MAVLSFPLLFAVVDWFDLCWTPRAAEELRARALIFITWTYLELVWLRHLELTSMEPLNLGDWFVSEELDVDLHFS